MQHFYREFIATGQMPARSNMAMQELRQQNPHPYFWALRLVGKVSDSEDNRLVT